MLIERKTRLQIYIYLLFIACVAGLFTMKINADHHDIWGGVENNMKHIIKNGDDIKAVQTDIVHVKARLDDLYKD